MQNETENKNVGTIQDLPDEILICENHPEYQVPLLSTMAFRGAEAWCPYCGMKIGMFDGGKNVQCTTDLKARHDKYQQATSEYLHAFGATYAAETLFEGKWVKPIDLPDEEKLRLKKLRESGWGTDIKIESII